MTGRARYLAGFLVTLALTESVASDALAHNEKTHQDIVNLAWQVMRAANRSGLGSAIAWEGGIPDDLPDLQSPGDCGADATDPSNLCGAMLSTDEWLTFLRTI